MYATDSPNRGNICDVSPAKVIVNYKLLNFNSEKMHTLYKNLVESQG